MSRPGTSRTQAMQVACPHCHAPAGVRCIGARPIPQPRVSCHRERHDEAALILGQTPTAA